MDETLDRAVLVQAFDVGHPYGPDIVDSARRAALVEDPRLQRVLAAGEERGTAYVVLERLPGRTLVDLLDAGPLPAETARRVIGEAAQALDRAAARGLHHLRLRPTSLLVGADGRVTVVGTAIDAAADGAESPNTSVATRSDAVGLVALLYAALTGRWPGAQDAGLPRAPRVAGRPVPPGDLVAGVPNDLDTLCAVALGPHDDGPRTPGELAGQLSPWAPATPLTDPRGLQIGGPARPAQNGAPSPFPGEDQPAETPARRTPAWGLRMRRRTGPETGSQPVLPPAVPVASVPSTSGPGAPVPGTSVPGTSVPGTSVPGTSVPGTSVPGTSVPPRSEVPVADDEPRVEPGNARPAWATIEELRRALRRTGAAVLPSGTAGPAPGAGLPLAAAAPPVGAPLSPAAEPAGAPLADVAPPSGPPTATPPAAADPVPLSAGAPVAPTPAPSDPAGPDHIPGPDDAREDSLDSADGAGERIPDEVRDRAKGDLRERDQDDVQEDVRRDSRNDGVTPDELHRADASDKLIDDLLDRRRKRRRDAPVDAAPAAPPAPAPDPAPTVVMPAAVGHAAPVPVGSVPAGSVPVDRWQGNGRDRYGPDSGGLDGLGMFATESQPADPFEAVAPFGPEVPLSRPPREQSRLVFLILAVLLVVVSVVAFRQLLNFHPAALITAGGGAPATPPGAKPSASTSATPSTSTRPSPSASPVAIAGVQALDPNGDESENNDLAARAIDGDSDSAWRSERYDNAQFGGIKNGVGLEVDLGDPVRVSTVTLTGPGSGGLVELRSSDSPDYDGSSRIARGRIDGSGRVTLSPGKAVTTRYLILWFTRAPQQSNGENRVIVDEIDVR